MQRYLSFITGLMAVLVLATACKESAEPPAAADPSSKPSATQNASASPGKPTAPVAIDYEVIGVPIVGHPVNVDIAVSSTQGEAPVKLSWQVLDTGSLSFPESQPREVSLRVNQRQAEMRQVTIVPQREGRLYLNVTAEVETPDGAMLKTMAIPIQVGGAPGEPEAAGEVKQDEEGEAVISLPADEG